MAGKPPILGDEDWRGAAAALSKNMLIDLLYLFGEKLARKGLRDIDSTTENSHTVSRALQPIITNLSIRRGDRSIDLVQQMETHRVRVTAFRERFKKPGETDAEFRERRRQTGIATIGEVRTSKKVVSAEGGRPKRRKGPPF
jgi:hypothetical protein